MKTLGGRQFWGDVRFFHGWRIQQNVFTKHYRLLDPCDVRHAWGPLAACLERLEAVKARDSLPPMSGKAVVLLHGITRSSKTFSKMHAALAADGYTVVGFDYPSTRVSIFSAADYLDSVVASLDGIGEIHLVAHSLGGLVARAWLDRRSDRRVNRMVMLGVPNQGSEMADLLRRSFLFRVLLGPAGQQLVTDPEGVAARLFIPKIEFAVIAGGSRKGRGYNPLISGDNDLLVSVNRSRLAGAADSLLVPVLHTLLPRSPAVIEATKRFLATGCLRESGCRMEIRQ